MMWMLFMLPALNLTAEEPTKLEFRKVPSSASSTAILKHGDILYAAGWKGLQVYKLTNPEKPELITSDARIIGRQMALSGDILYITARENGLWILDISKPEQPQVLTRFDTAEMATGIVVSNNIVFISERIYGVEILDCTNPKTPRHIGFARGGEVQSVTLHNNTLFGGSWGGGDVQMWNVSDLSSPKKAGRLQLDGFGDGVAVQGKYLYAATGMHAKSGPKAKRENAGHGLEIFDISNLGKIVRTGIIKFPPHKTKYFDGWSVIPDGNTAYVSDTNNGVFIVDVSDKSKPAIIASGKLPDCWGSEECAASLAPGNGVLYAGGTRGGLYLAVWPDAKAVQPVKDNSVLKESKEARKEPAGFKRYDLGGQVRRLFVDGDTLYAACSHLGIRSFRITNDGLLPLKTYPLECSYDIAVRNGCLYSAEGKNGLAVYQIEAGGALKELGRSKKPCTHIRMTSDSRWLITSSGSISFAVLNVSDPANITTAFHHQAWTLFYTETAGEQDINGVIPVNCHGTGVVWLDLNGEKPLIKYHHKAFLADQMSAATVLNGKFIFPTASGYVEIDPVQPEKGIVKNYRISGIRQPSGTASSDGNTVVFTNRSSGDITTVDFSNPGSPELLKNRSLSGIPGSPDRAVFWKHRLIIPAGFYGILFENKQNQPLK